MLTTHVAAAGIAMFFKIAEVSERNACSLKIDFMNRRGEGCDTCGFATSIDIPRLHALSLLGCCCNQFSSAIGLPIALPFLKYIQHAMHLSQVQVCHWIGPALCSSCRHVPACTRVDSCLQAAAAGLRRWRRHAQTQRKLGTMQLALVAACRRLCEFA